VPDSIKRLSDFKKDTPAILSSLNGRGNGISDAEALLGSRMEGSETNLVGGDDLLRFDDRKKALKYIQGGVSSLIPRPCLTVTNFTIDHFK
jgi:hypothetical protein